MKECGCFLEEGRFDLTLLWLLVGISIIIVDILVRSQNARDG